MTFVTSEPYVGHLGLDGVGDTKGMLESEFRQRHIKWITNARVVSAAASELSFEEVKEDSSVLRVHTLPFRPACRLNPVPIGIPKTGFMIESMVTATARNIAALLRDKPIFARATWNAVCLADFGESGIAFVAQLQIPPRNVNWSSQGTWVHLAKVAFERYFLRKIRRGESEPFYKRFLMERMNIAKLKEVATEKV